MTGREASLLRAALAGHEAGRGKRYSAGIKARIIEFAQGRRTEGASWATIASELGLAFETVRRWCIPEQVATRMLPVRVVADRPATVSVVSPAGHRNALQETR